MSAIVISVTPEERMKFDVFTAHFAGMPGKAFSYIVAQYLGVEIKESVFLPKSPEEIASLYGMSSVKSPAPPQLKLAYKILCENAVPTKFVKNSKLNVNLAAFLENDFNQAVIDTGASSRNQLAKRAFRAWTGSGLDSDIENLFVKIRAYGEEMPPKEALLQAGMDPVLAAVLNLPEVRTVYEAWAR